MLHNSAFSHFNRGWGRLLSNSQWCWKGKRRGTTAAPRALAAQVCVMGTKPASERSEADCIPAFPMTACSMGKWNGSLCRKTQHREDRMMLSTSRQRGFYQLGSLSSANSSLGKGSPRQDLCSWSTVSDNGAHSGDSTPLKGDTTPLALTAGGQAAPCHVGAVAVPHLAGCAGRWLGCRAT